MRAEFLELDAADKSNGVDLHAEVRSDTDGRLLATVLRIPPSRDRFGTHTPTYICGCWPTAADRYDCVHILVVKAALEAATPPRPA